MKFKKANEGVSEIISTVLLLGMAISFFSLLCITVLSYPSSSHSPSANLVGMIGGGEGDHLMIEHRGGEALSLDTKVIITIKNEMSIPETVRDGIDSDANKDNFWGIGEWYISPDLGNLTDKQIEITVIDVESNSIIMTGLLQGS